MLCVAYEPPAEEAARGRREAAAAKAASLPNITQPKVSVTS